MDELIYQEDSAVSSSVVEDTFKIRKSCQYHWQNYIFRQKWSNLPMFLFTITMQDVKREN